MMTKKQKQKQTTKQNSSRRSAPESATELTFIEHIHEVRGRLMWIVASLIAASTVAYQFRDQLVNVIIAPLHGEKLVYLNPGGGFTFIFTVCLYFGALVTIPVIMYHLYSFLQPVIGRRSRRLMVGIVFTSVLLAVIGIGFGYMLVIPGAIHFLGGFAGDSIVANLTTDSYLNFTVMHLFGMAALFQLPLLLFIIDHIRPLPPGMLFRLQRWVIAGSIIAAAIITPTPDPANLFLVAVPIIGIYQIGVVIVWLRRRSYHAARRTLVPKSSTTSSRLAPKSVLAAQIDLPAPSESMLAANHPQPAAESSEPAAVTSHQIRPLAGSSVKSMDGIAPRPRVRTTVPALAVPQRNSNRTIQHANRSATAASSGRRVSMDGILI